MRFNGPLDVARTRPPSSIAIPISQPSSRQGQVEEEEELPDALTVETMPTCAIDCGARDFYQASHGQGGKLSRLSVRVRALLGSNHD